MSHVHGLPPHVAGEPQGILHVELSSLKSCSDAFDAVVRSGGAVGVLDWWGQDTSSPGIPRLVPRNLLTGCSDAPTDCSCEFPIRSTPKRFLAYLRDMGEISIGLYARSKRPIERHLLGICEIGVASFMRGLSTAPDSEYGLCVSGSFNVVRSTGDKTVVGRLDVRLWTDWAAHAQTRARPASEVLSSFERNERFVQEIQHLEQRQPSPRAVIVSPSFQASEPLADVRPRFASQADKQVSEDPWQQAAVGSASLRTALHEPLASSTPSVAESIALASTSQLLHHIPSSLQGRRVGFSSLCNRDVESKRRSIRLRPRPRIADAEDLPEHCQVQFASRSSGSTFEATDDRIHLRVQLGSFRACRPSALLRGVKAVYRLSASQDVTAWLPEENSDGSDSTMKVVPVTSTSISEAGIWRTEPGAGGSVVRVWGPSPAALHVQLWDEEAPLPARQQQHGGSCYSRHAVPLQPAPVLLGLAKLALPSFTPELATAALSGSLALLDGEVEVFAVSDVAIVGYPSGAATSVGTLRVALTAGKQQVLTQAAPAFLPSAPVPRTPPPLPRSEGEQDSPEKDEQPEPARVDLGSAFAASCADAPSGDGALSSIGSLGRNLLFAAATMRIASSGMTVMNIARPSLQAESLHKGGADLVSLQKLQRQLLWHVPSLAPSEAAAAIAVIREEASAGNDHVPLEFAVELLDGAAACAKEGVDLLICQVGQSCGHVAQQLEAMAAGAAPCQTLKRSALTAWFRQTLRDAGVDAFRWEALEGFYDAVDPSGTGEVPLAALAAIVLERAKAWWHAQGQALGASQPAQVWGSSNPSGTASLVQSEDTARSEARATATENGCSAAWLAGDLQSSLFEALRVSGVLSANHVRALLEVDFDSDDTNTCTSTQLTISLSHFADVLQRRHPMPLSNADLLFVGRTWLALPTSTPQSGGCLQVGEFARSFGAWLQARSQNDGVSSDQPPCSRHEELIRQLEELLQASGLDARADINQVDHQTAVGRRLACLARLASAAPSRTMPSWPLLSGDSDVVRSTREASTETASARGT